MGIKKQKTRQGKNIKIDLEHVEIEKQKHPVFCFKYLHRDYCLEQCDINEKKSLIEQIVRLSNCTWDEIQLHHRHGLGSEKISISSIKPSLPYAPTKEIDHLLALRFEGKKSFIGHRNQFIFHVLFIDRTFDVYKH